MKKYLIINHYFKGTYLTDNLQTEDLVRRKQGDCDEIIDLVDGTYYDPDKNTWVAIKSE